MHQSLPPARALGIRLEDAQPPVFGHTEATTAKRVLPRAAEEILVGRAQHADQTLDRVSLPFPLQDRPLVRVTHVSLQR